MVRKTVKVKYFFNRLRWSCYDLQRYAKYHCKEEGDHLIWRNSNDYGLSLIREPDLTFEVAVIKFTGPGAQDYHMIFDTFIARDVFYIKEIEEVYKYLKEVDELSKSVPALWAEIIGYFRSKEVL